MTEAIRWMRGEKRPNSISLYPWERYREVLRLLREHLKKVEDVRKSYLGNHKFKKIIFKNTCLQQKKKKIKAVQKDTKEKVQFPLYHPPSSQRPELSMYLPKNLLCICMYVYILT